MLQAARTKSFKGHFYKGNKEAFVFFLLSTNDLARGDDVGQLEVPSDISLANMHRYRAELMVGVQH